MHLLGRPGFVAHPDAHAREHSIEIELPLLCRVLGAGFELVPVLVSNIDGGHAPAMADALHELMDDRTVLVASSDFTHFGASFDYQPFPADERCPERLHELDHGAIEHILDLDGEGFERFRRQSGITVCGHESISLLIETLRRESVELESMLLGYETSGAINGDYHHSVSYVAAAFLSPRSPVSHLELDRDVRHELFEIARRAIAVGAASSSLEPSAIKVREGGSGVWCEPRAVFVTLRRGRELRGCVGTTTARDPLPWAVAHSAWSAACQDERFAPVTPDEVAELSIEISVLSEPSVIRSREEIVLGRDGVIIEKAGARAVFLPAVAAEQGWDRDQLLCQLATKARLPATPWDDGAMYAIFQAEEFSEPGGDW
jgi:AmmeMemoRadiSam system protein A